MEILGGGFLIMGLEVNSRRENGIQKPILVMIAGCISMLTSGLPYGYQVVEIITHIIVFVNIIAGGLMLLSGVLMYRTKPLVGGILTICFSILSLVGFLSYFIGGAGNPYGPGGWQDPPDIWWNTLEGSLELVVGILFIGGILSGPVLGIVMGALVISEDNRF
jgi:hypothetical protein